MKINSKVKQAVENLHGLRERWEETPEWHGNSNKESFRNGTIKIDTGDLEDTKTLLDWVENELGESFRTP